MAILRRSAVVALALAMMCLAVGVPGASAAGSLVAFDFTVRNLGDNATLQLTYNTGVIDGAGGQAAALGLSAIDRILFSSSSMELHSSGLSASQSFHVTQYMVVGSAPVTGVATIPSGASVSFISPETGDTVKLTNGPFSIPTGVRSAPGAKAPTSGGQTVRCRGNGRSCQARVSIAGGASDRRITIRLTDANLSLQSVAVSPHRSRRAYSLSDGRFKLGGSEYVVTLNAAQANPSGSHLTLTFVRRPPPRNGRG